MLCGGGHGAHDARPDAATARLLRADDGPTRMRLKEPGRFVLHPTQRVGHCAAAREQARDSAALALPSAKEASPGRPRARAKPGSRTATGREREGAGTGREGRALISWLRLRARPPCGVATREYMTASGRGTPALQVLVGEPQARKTARLGGEGGGGECGVRLGSVCAQSWLPARALPRLLRRTEGPTPPAAAWKLR
jgi:hypothetical protein